MSTLKERFETKFKKIKSGCWEWIAGSRGVGYGAIKVKGKTIDAHRISYLIYRGEIPENLNVCHTCDNRKCVNPDHLFLGTHSDNMQDCSKKNRLSIQNPKVREKIKQALIELQGIKITDNRGNIFNSLTEVRDFYNWKSLNYIRQQLFGDRPNKYGFKLSDGEN